MRAFPNGSLMKCYCNSFSLLLFACAHTFALCKASLPGAGNATDFGSPMLPDDLLYAFNDSDGDSATLAINMFVNSD